MARRLAIAASAAVALVVLVLPPAATPAPVRRDLRVPLSGPPSVATPFSPPAQRWLAGHRGVDLVAAAVAEVRAPAAGTVLFAGAVGGRRVLSIDHGDGLRTTYEPVRATVRAGDAVGAGDLVGHLVAGHPGCPAVACLHWGARLAAGGPGGDDDEYLDPLGLLATDARAIRLKPTRPGDGGG
ncbi:M23 family metallopeptidase [Dietzia sp. UBA5065]|jgi:murein DD-endopeptidase MepM/ murein hydrolase activator NlpD|uniref:M23 family metallopeptidase n=1 Tax=Dietzia sp. UBA5065 TaxID=1946422 RepID=UPI0025BE3A85|nr:peptidoglycan DD-metalloendopeptidase family protein [Dietzia sp. UBA5065]